MGNDKLYEASRRGVISEETYREILKYKERLQKNGVPVIYNLRHVRKIFQIKRKEQELFFGAQREALYYQFEIPKKSGGKRTIEAPCDRLKKIQRWIKDEIIDSFYPSEYATGFRKGISIVDNAMPHIGKELVINFDLKDFFPSVTYAEILKLFVYMGYRLDVAHLLTKICTNSENVLPQGSPASPSISNLVLLKLDKRLSSLAKTISCSYSRYADDITFSGNKSIKSIVPLVIQIITDEGYTVNENKIRLQYANQRQEVTGLTVNTKLAVSKNITDEIEKAIYFCNKFGVSSHMKHIACDKHFYREHLYGIAYFIMMVDPQKGKIYLKELNDLNWV